MLINLTISNWMSFRDKTTFTMIAGKEQQHSERLSRIDKYRCRILPIAALYGGNASGKTNFFQAIRFSKDFIVTGTQPDAVIPVEPFCLDEKVREAPSSFIFEILIDGDFYEFYFSVNYSQVLEEKLTQITSSSEKVLYHRQTGNKDPHFHGSMTDKKRMAFAFEGTRDNQLFLNNSVSQKLDAFKNVFDWFNKTLVLVAPDSRFSSFEHFIQEQSALYKVMNTLLPAFDTGICRLGGEEISFDSLDLPHSVRQQVMQDVKIGQALKLISPDNERIIIIRNKDKLIVKKLYTYHKDIAGNEIKFDIKQESDGSKRIIDLLPAFLDLTINKNPKVFIIDEMDRSLHSLLTRQLLDVYLKSCAKNKSAQLLFTSHDLMLMNQELFRRDEIWIMERQQDGSSRLFSFSDYSDIRNDKDIRKSYLQGRMGGVPNLLINQNLFQDIAEEIK